MTNTHEALAQVREALAGTKIESGHGAWLDQRGMKLILDHVEAQAAEIERLTACLKKANDQAEHFEREWYLRGDEIERLETDVRKLDFLELNGIGCDKIGGLGYSVWINGVRYDGDTARNAIDAAMRGSDE